MPPQADRCGLLAHPGRVVDQPAVGAVFDIEPAGRPHIERHHQVVRVTAEGGAGRRAAPGAPVHGPAHIVERGHLDPQSEEETRLSARRNPESIARLLAEAGFAAPEIEELPVAYRFADADELWFFVCELRGPVALALAELDEAARADVRAAVEARATRAGDGFELGGVSLNVVTS